MIRKMIAHETRDLRKIELSLKRAKERPNAPRSEVEQIEDLFVLRNAILEFLERMEIQNG